MDQGRGGDAVYEFAEFRLVAAKRQLLSRTDGRPIDLTQKAFDALLYLVRHRGELLDKAALLKALWPNVIVEENNLNQAISALRRALGNSEGENRFIVTVPGRGYQFVAAVTEAMATDAPGSQAPPARQPAPAHQPSATVGPAHKASIAVLPFASLSGDPEKDYFADGIAEELIHLLARVPGLKVPARTSSFAYKGRNTDVRQIARDLGVAMLLEGSVRSAGDRIRVTAQLIEAESGFHIWSQTYDRQFSDVFQLQDELAGNIVQALKINLGDARAPSLRDAPPTKNLEAYELYMQVRAMWGRSIAAGVAGERVIGLLNRIVALDPEFARAHAQLATVHGARLSLGIESPGILADIKRSAERALALDPQVSSAHLSMGALHAAQGRWLAADASCRRAIDLDPDEPSAYALYGVLVLGPSGKLKQALDTSRQAYQLGPAIVSSAVSMAGFNQLLGHDEETARYVQVAVNLGMPELQMPLSTFRSQLARRAGRYEEARDIILAALPVGIRIHGGDETVQRVYAALADIRQSPAAVSALRAWVKGGDPTLMNGAQMIVLTLNWYAMLGALDDAFEAAQRLVQNFGRTGILSTAHLGAFWLPEHRALRRDPRFHDIAAGLGLFDYWKEHGPPDDCDLKDGRLIAH
jgi:TolB-like protein/Tfp pilus assembly protein PilF